MLHLWAGLSLDDYHYDELASTFITSFGIDYVNDSVINTTTESEIDEIIDLQSQPIQSQYESNNNISTQNEIQPNHGYNLRSKRSDKEEAD